MVYFYNNKVPLNMFRPIVIYCFVRKW